ncbi:hypothetical protein B0H11DRAFT_2286288 [Mycena galericulata]|nr:hypothetical protein B0H11DRAFT_2286288 [Mycena galericulata]
MAPLYFHTLFSLLVAGLSFAAVTNVVTTAPTSTCTGSSTVWSITTGTYTTILTSTDWTTVTLTSTIWYNVTSTSTETASDTITLTATDTASSTITVTDTVTETATLTSAATSVTSTGTITITSTSTTSSDTTTTYTTTPTTTTSTSTSTTTATSTATSTCDTASAPTATSWTYLGCYPDNVSARTLNGYGETVSADTVASCQTTCLNRGYKYAGVEDGVQCFCDSSIKAGVTPGGTCTTACGGGAGTCGGDDAIDIYEAVVAPCVTPWTYRGCYSDNVNSRILNGYGGTFSTNSVASCQTTCLDRGYTYAGVEDGVQCFCASSIGSSGTLQGESNCQTRCGNGVGTCGGVDYIGIYEAAKTA